MKIPFIKIMFSSILFSTILYAQMAQLSVYDITVSAFDFSKSKDGKTGFILAKQNKSAKEIIQFGYWFPVDSKIPFVVLNDENGKQVASISSKEFASGAEITNEKNKTTAAFTFGKGANSVEIKFVAELKDNAMMPLSKVLEMEVFVKTNQKKNIQAVINLFADGFVSKVGTNGLAVSKVEKGKAVFPQIMISGVQKSSAAFEISDAKKPGAKIKLSSSSVSLNVGVSSSVAKYSIVSSSVKEIEKSVSQIKNVEKALSQNQETTEMAVLNSASISNPFPGDTVIFTIRYHNIGTAPATDIEISNPIPANMNFVENSASGENSEITYQRKKSDPPVQGEVIGVMWKIKNKIAPGEEGTVSMKAVVR